MEYEVPDALGTSGRMGGGRSVLVVGPPGSGKRALVWETLRTGRKGGAVFVSATDPVDGLGFDFRTVDPDEPEVWAVDASGETTVSAVGGAHGRVEVADGPADFTGIGVGLSRQLGALETPNPHRRVGIDGLGALLARADRESVFKFLYTLRSRAGAAGWLVFVTLDDDAVDDADRLLVRDAVDLIVETRRSGEEYELRTDGPDGEWRRWEPSFDL